MSTEAKVQDEMNSLQRIPSPEIATPSLAQRKSQKLSTPAVEFRNVYFSFDDPYIQKFISGTEMEPAETRTLLNRQ